MVTFAEIMKVPLEGGYWDIDEFNNRGEGFKAPDGKTWYLEEPEDVAEILGMKSLESLRQWLSRERSNHTQICKGPTESTAIPNWKRQELLLKLLKISDQAWLKLNLSDFRTQWEETNELSITRAFNGFRWADILFGDTAGRGLQIHCTPTTDPMTYEDWLKDRRDRGQMPPENPQARYHPGADEDERPSFEGFFNNALPVRLGREDVVMTFRPADNVRCSGWTTTILVRATPAPSPNRQVWSLLPRYVRGKMKNPEAGYHRERLDAEGCIEISPIALDKGAFEIVHEYWVFMHQEGDLDKGKYATYFRDKFLEKGRPHLDTRLLNEWAQWIWKEQEAGRARWTSCTALPYWPGRSPSVDEWAEGVRRGGRG